MDKYKHVSPTEYLEEASQEEVSEYENTTYNESVSLDDNYSFETDINVTEKIIS